MIYFRQSNMSIVMFADVVPYEEDIVDENIAEKQMATHYETLKSKMEEKKPNQLVISQLLDLEFKAHQNYIEAVKGTIQHRIETVLHAYPCFSSPVNVRHLIVVFKFLKIFLPDINPISHWNFCIIGT